MKVNLELSAKLSELQKIKDILVGNHDIPETLQKKIYLSVEELFVNICDYGYGKQEKNQVNNENQMIQFQLEKLDQQIVIDLLDFGVPYNPLEQVITAEEYEFEIGGLGKLIAFSLMDDAKYEYVDGKNHVTLVKNIDE